MQLPLLLIADTSVPEALGNKLLRGAKGLGLQLGKDIQVMYTSPSQTHSPSMKKLQGKIIYKLADKRSLEWWSFQKELREKIKLFEPKLVLVTGILALKPIIFKEIYARHGCVANYLTDDPWNPIHRRRLFLKNLCLYNHIFS